VTLNNRTYLLSALSFDQLTLRASDRNYEPDLASLFHRELHLGGGHFVDVGANHAQTLLAVLSISSDIPYVGIEPQALCVASISSFIQVNRLKSHKIICASLSNVMGATNLQHSKAGDVRASIVPEYRLKDMFEHQISTVTLSGDRLIAELGIEKVQLIKVDVEGAELEVIQSFKSTLVNHKPLVVFEILPDILVSTGATLPADVVAERRRRENAISMFLKQVGYETSLNQEGHEQPSAIGPDKDGKVRNYVARAKPN